MHGGIQLINLLYSLSELLSRTGIIVLALAVLPFPPIFGLSNSCCRTGCWHKTDVGKFTFVISVFSTEVIKTQPCLYGCKILTVTHSCF